MFHFQQIFSVNWIEHDQLEIKPKKYSLFLQFPPIQPMYSSIFSYFLDRPDVITDEDLGFLSEIIGNAQSITILTFDLRSYPPVF